MEEKVIKDDHTVPKTKSSLNQTGISFSERSNLESTLLDKMAMMVFIMIAMIIQAVVVWEYRMTELTSTPGEQRKTQKIFKERPYGYTEIESTQIKTSPQDTGFDEEWQSSIHGIESETTSNSN